MNWHNLLARSERHYTAPTLPDAESNPMPIDESLHADFRHLLAHWNNWRQDRPAPSRSQIDPLPIYRLLPRLTLSDVIESGSDFRYRLAGTAICDLHGFELRHRRPSDFQQASFGRILLGHYRSCVEEAKPRFDRISLNPKDKHCWYARLLLPLSNNGHDIDGLLGLDLHADSDRIKRHCQRSNLMGA